MRSVNLACLAATLVWTACGPSPRPVSPLNAPPYGALLGNPRRALFETEPIPLRQPSVDWEQDAGSGMRNTVVVIDSIVLVTTTNRRIIAFNRYTGRRHWYQHLGNGATSTLLYDDNTVFVGTDEYDGELIALNTERGRRRWKVRLGAIRFTPLLDQGVLYAGTDGGVVAAVDAKSGSVIWRHRVNGGLAETPLDRGTDIIVFTGRDSVLAMRKSNGTVVARAALPATPSAAPALVNGTILVPTQDSAIVALDASTLAMKWRARTQSPVLTAPAVTRDGVAYLAARNGTLYRVAGEQPEVVAELGHAISASLTLARDHLLLGSYDGTLLAVNFSGDVVWRHRFRDSIVAPVAVGDNSIYVPLLRGRVVKLR